MMYTEYGLSGGPTQSMFSFAGLSLGTQLLVLALLIAWLLYWKGAALWKAARENNLGWFIALLIIQTLGILEILYIYVFSKGKKK